MQSGYQQATEAFDDYQNFVSRTFGRRFVRCIGGVRAEGSGGADADA
jgi:hypothetical protein